MKKVIFIIAAAAAVLFAVYNYNHYEIITHFNSLRSNIYAAPLPGEVNQHSDVAAAREHYKNKKVKFLVNCYFRGEGIYTQISEEEKIKEYQRLSSEGYDLYKTKAWTYKNKGEKEYYDVILVLLTEEQIENFKINEKYGYFFRFVHNGDMSPIKFHECKKYNPF